jgi:hypothetical protein
MLVPGSPYFSIYSLCRSFLKANNSHLRLLSWQQKGEGKCLQINFHLSFFHALRRETLTIHQAFQTFFSFNSSARNWKNSANVRRLSGRRRSEGGDQVEPATNFTILQFFIYNFLSVEKDIRRVALYSG